MRRTYGQYCTLARALDVIGERWTLLVVRELMLGPRRFKELLAGLPGISRNLLAERLRQLEAEGLIRRRKSAPQARRHVYELTERGRALRPALTELARWGAGRLDPLRPGEAFQGQWVVSTMVATADRNAARGVHETYGFEFEGDAFHLRVDDGSVAAHLGHADDPTVVIRTSPQVVSALATGTQSVEEALAEGEFVFEGDPAALERCLAIFGPAWGLEFTSPT